MSEMLRLKRPPSTWGEQRWCALEAHIMSMSLDELCDATHHYSAWTSRAPSIDQLRHHVLIAIHNAAVVREIR
jgi:hypothetical protein